MLVKKSLTETAADAQDTVYLLRNRELATESNFEMTEEVDDHCKKNIMVNMVNCRL